MTDKIYTSDFGTKITNNLQTDITGYATIKYLYTKPDATTGEFALAVENLTCGIVYYVTEENDLDVAGDWSFQVEVDYTTSKFLANTFIVKVYAPYT